MQQASQRATAVGLDILLDRQRGTPLVEAGQRVQASIHFVEWNKAQLGLSPTCRPTPPLCIPPMATPIPICLTIPTIMEP